MFQCVRLVVPIGERLAKIMADFERINRLPQSVGAIDGSHIRLQMKSSKKYFLAQYICRHGFLSILLEGVVDANKLFL